MAGIDNILPEGACVVSVMHMVNPGTFWVSEPPDKDMTKERRELQDLEESLQEHCRHISFYKQNCCVPEQEEMVAVEHPKTRRWHRGKVECVLTLASGYVYKVFLVDHGESIQVRSSSMQQLPASCDSLGYQAMQVVLYGVVPVTRELDYEHTKMKTKVLDHWTVAAVRFVRELLDKCVKAYVVHHKNTKHLVYGDLYLDLEQDGIVSLKNLLCDNEYAIFSEELFGLDNNEDGTDGKSSSSTDNFSSPCRSPRKSERHSIREYVNEYNIRKKMKEKDTMDKIEQWRHHNKLFEHEGENSDEDTPVGRGMRVRTRSQINPGRIVQKEQNTACDSRVKEATDKSLLDFLDMICDVGEYVSEPSHPIETSKPSQAKPSEASNFISYMPAGAAIPSNLKNKTYAKQLTHAKPSYHTNITSNPQKNYKKSSSEQLKLVGNSGINIKAEKFKSLPSENSSVHGKSDHNKKDNENSTDFKKLSELPFPDTASLPLECLNTTDDGKAYKLINVSSQDNICEYSSKLIGNSIDTKNLSIDKMSLGVNSEEEGSQENVSLATAKPMSLFERLQEKTKRTNRKTEDVMQNIMDGVIKSTKSKSKVQLSSLKSSEQQSGTPLTEEHHLKSVMGLPVNRKLMDRSSAARLLVHGDMRSHPIQSVADANFPSEIHEALKKMDLKSPMRTQMYAWPAIMRGQYTILVGPPRSGKTLSYIVPVVSFMLTPDMYSELPPGNGPLVLVLCSGSRSAEFIYEKCCSLLQEVKQMEVRVQLALGGSCEIDLRDQLANGCDILVSTPRCFLRLLCCSHLITNLDRLAHLVVDEVDILADKFLPEVKKILVECKHVLKQRAKFTVPIQLIAASEKWCPAVEQFSQHVSQDFVICISGHLEAAVYAKLRPSLHYLSSSDKVQKLLDILDGERGLYKTLVICKNAEEVDMLEPFLMSQCLNFVTVHEDKTLSHNRETYQHWKNCVSGNYPVLVCSDDVLPELDVHDALLLIHYSLPPTKTKFGFRFSSLMNNYSSVFHKSSAHDDDPDCMVHIFIDKDNDSKALPEVVQLMKRLSIQVHPDIEARATESMKQQQSQKSSAPLCFNIKAFGECLEKTSCPNRHIVLSALDEPVNIPRHGNVKLKILYVLDASRFAARLLQYKDENDSTVQVSDEYFTITMAVLKHYSNERNRGLHGVPKLGDICGLENKINTFQRVQVMEITRQDEKNVPEEVRVYFLDEGIFREVKIYQLLSLPSHLQQLPSQTVEVFLCNVIPCDLDTCWSQEASYRMSSWIRNITVGETSGKFMIGKIVLSLGNTLWLDPLKCCSHLESVDTHVTEVSLRMELLKSKLAVQNPKHLNNLLTMCKEAQIYVPTYNPVERRPVEHKAVLPTPQWAYLPSDGYQTVFFIYAVDPHKFYVRRHDFDKCFQELVTDIQECVKTKPKDFHVEEGSLCFGKFPDDGIWYRARVDEILEENLVSLFFVDHGDLASVSMDDIAPITHKLITKLPFQAIECSLAGLNPVNGDIWCEDATDVLYDFIDNNSIIHVKVCEVLEKEHHVGGKKYQVLCVDTSTEKDIVLNQILVERNLAVSNNMDKLKEEISLEQDGSSNESNIEIDSCKEVRSSNMRPEEEDSQDEYDIVMDDVELFVKRMFGLDRLEQIMSPPSVDTIKLPALPALNNTMHRTSSVDSLSSGCLSDEECVPPFASHTKIPEVLWYQDYYTIDLKIKLTGVDQYYLSWDLINFNFRTELNDDIYEVGGKLFGPIISSELSHSAKGLYVNIKMKKGVCGFTWPRLFNSKNRKPWLKYDLDKLKCDLDMLKEDSDIFLQSLDLGKSPGVELKEWEGAEIIPEFVDTDEEGDRDDDDDDGPDVFDVIDALYDPLDPLN